MLIYGLDFTSAPARRKPITCAACERDGDRLIVRGLERFTGFTAFQAFLARPGPWIAGFDFPFGLPRATLAAWGFAEVTWAEVVRAISHLDKATYLAQIKAFREARPAGQKHPLRHTDQVAGAVSPLMVYGVPVGRMFFEGAPRLLAAGVHVAPVHPTGDTRIALETYPALVVRHWLGKRPYKSDVPAKQTHAQQQARETLLDHLRAEAKDVFGVALALPDALAHTLVTDPSGDSLDALLCALQTTWASTQPDYGVPSTVESASVEGWIVSPILK